MRFVYTNSKYQELHWHDCERNNNPYIEISEFSEMYMQISYDISNYKVELGNISDSVKNIYKSYIDFVMIPYSDVVFLFDQYYFFNIIVLREHAEFIADKLFYFLNSRL
jgi:hypothetical protein